MECRIKDIPVYYEIYGQGRPLLTIHGCPVDHHIMKGCLEPIFQQRAGWQRIYFDLPGMGNTPARDWIANSGHMLEIVEAFIDQILPGQTFAIAGESYGGYIARGLLARRMARVDGVLFICPAIVAEREKRDVPAFQVLVQDPAVLPMLAQAAPPDREGYENIVVVQTPRTWERMRRDVIVGLHAADYDFCERLAPQFVYDVGAAITIFDRPTLFVMGRQDDHVGYRDAWKILEQYPRATFAVLDCAGHNLQFEQERLFEALVNEWLDRLERVV